MAGPGLDSAAAAVAAAAAGTTAIATALKHIHVAFRADEIADFVCTGVYEL